MSKFTLEQRKRIKSLVLEGVCEHKTTMDMIDYLKERGFEISYDEINRYRQSLRKEAHQWIRILAKSKYEYVAEYRLRIQEVEYNIRRANELYKETEDRNLKRKLLLSMSYMSKMVMDMYDAMPIVKDLTDLIKDYSNAGNGNGDGKSNDDRDRYTSENLRILRL